MLLSLPRIILLSQNIAGMLNTDDPTANISYHISRLFFFFSILEYRVMVLFSLYSWSISSPPFSLKFRIKYNENIKPDIVEFIPQGVKVVLNKVAVCRS